MAVPSTLIELVRRLTAHEVTPGTFLTARSTLAEHAAQLIPVTVYWSDMNIHGLFLCDGSIILHGRYFLLYPSLFRKSEIIPDTPSVTAMKGAFTPATI